jgi:hypothetical protein
MSNVSRHRPQDSLEWFYQEWHGRHVQLMREAPGVMRLVLRYVQNRALHDKSLPEPALPLGKEGWDSMSQLSFADVSSFVACFEDPDYIAQVRSHQFSDPSVIVSMLTSAVDVLPGPLPGEALKAVQFYRTPAGRTAEGLLAALDGEYRAAIGSQPGLLRVVRSTPSANVSREVFIGSRWEGVPFNLFTVFDELYFRDRDSLAAYLAGGRARDALAALANDHLDPRSFTFLCREIVQIDNIGVGK